MTKTYELFQTGETVGIFQYESAWDAKAFKGSQANCFCRFNCNERFVSSGTYGIYPKFCASKTRKEEITYDLDEMEEYLQETYGITYTKSR